MALIKFDKKGFIESLEPGITCYVMQQFIDRLEKKLNDVVSETYKELQKELPRNIKVKIHDVISLLENQRQIAVEVDLRASIKE